MSFIEPMLAGPLTKKIQIRSDTHVAELKYDGIRAIVTVGPRDLVNGIDVKAWTRNANAIALPLQMELALVQLPAGVYDGELIAKNRQKSFHVKTKGEELHLVIFDALEVEGRSQLNRPWAYRRHELTEYCFRGRTFDSISLSRPIALSDREHLARLTDETWNDGHEGLIVKSVNGLYRPGKRGVEFVKIKKKERALLTIVGFERGKGAKIDRGPHAVTVLEDADGNRVTVKTLNDAELAALDNQAANVTGGFALEPDQHPAIGRQLWIEYQERTVDGGYRHPMWDRWFDPEVDA